MIKTSKQSPLFASRILEEISMSLCFSDWISEQRMTKLNHKYEYFCNLLI